MNRLVKTLSFATATLAALVVLAAPAAQAQKTDTIDGGGITTVTLSEGFVSALKSLDVTAGTVSPTLLQGGKVDFPISGGALDLDTASGQFLHTGGLTLTAGSTSVKLQSFIIDTTGSTPVITGLVSADGKLLGRLTLFDLALPSNLKVPIKLDYGFLVLNGVGVTLDAGAAKALNSVFKVSAFTGGLNIGSAQVIAYLPPCCDFQL